MLRSLGLLLDSFQHVRDKLSACIYQHAFLMYWKQVLFISFSSYLFFRNKGVSHHLLLVLKHEHRCKRGGLAWTLWVLGCVWRGSGSKTSVASSARKPNALSVFIV